MNKSLTAAALLAVSAAVTGVAHSRGYRNGAVFTPFGSFNTNSPGYRMAGGNPFLAEQIREEIMMQKMMLLQMERVAKLEAKRAKTMKDPKLRAAYEAQQEAALTAPHRKTMKKHHTTTTSSVGVGATKEATAAKEANKTDGKNTTAKTDTVKK